MKNVFCPAIVLALLTGCNTGNPEGKTHEEKIISVSTTPVKMERITVNLGYSGTIEPVITVPLTFQTNGTIEKVMVEAGDAVKKGQLLASIDKSNYQNMYNIANSKYQQAKDAYTRLKSVYEKGSLSDIKWVEMETNLKQAESSLEISRSNLEKCEMRAPSDGIIGRRNIEPGMASLSISAAPIELVDIKKVYIKIAIPENEIGMVKKGTMASFTVAALNNQKFSGEISSVSPVADAISRTYEGKILVNNPNLDLKPGMVCDVALQIPIQKEMLCVPYTCVSKDNNGNSFVFVADTVQKKALKRLLKTGNYCGNNLEVLSGLSIGEKVVNEGKEKLSDHSLISF